MVGNIDNHNKGFNFNQPSWGRKRFRETMLLSFHMFGSDLVCFILVAIGISVIYNASKLMVYSFSGLYGFK